jgi:tetratricopeptide (TPR) repeat protein
VAVAISLLIGTIGTTWQWLRATQKQTQTVAALELAEKNLQLALDAVDKLLEHASNPDLAQVPLVQPTRKRILEDALNFYEQLHLASSDSANLRLRAAVTRLRLGVLAAEMGQNDLSEKMFVDAQVRLEELAHQFPNVASYRYELADAHLHLGWFYDHTEPDFEKAIGQFENANAEYKLLAGLVPNQSTVF